MVRSCRSPISSISASIPPIRCRPGRSRSRSWSSCARPSICRRWRSPTPAICSARSNSPPTCAAAGIQPIIGCEIALERNGAQEANRPGRGPAAAGPDRSAGAERGRLPQPAGARQPILSRGRNGRPSRRSRLPTSPRASDGLICLTGGPGGPVGRLVAEGQADAAEARFDPAHEPVPGPALCRAACATARREEAGSNRASSISPIATICRWSPPTTPISRIASSTRRTMRCSASPRAPSSPTRTASG